MLRTLESYSKLSIQSIQSNNNNDTNDIDDKIKIVNLERRPDRKENMIEKLKQQNITNYEFIRAVDGRELEPTDEVVLCSSTLTA
jgi:hypothetical protein